MSTHDKRSGELPCPFCAGTKLAIFDDAIGYAVMCDNDHCPVNVVAEGETREEALEHWNRRTDAAPQGKPTGHTGNGPDTELPADAAPFDMMAELKKRLAPPSAERAQEPGHDWQPDGGVLRFESHPHGEAPHVHTTCAKCCARAWFLEFQWALLAKGCAKS